MLRVNHKLTPYQLQRLFNFECYQREMMFCEIFVIGEETVVACCTFPKVAVWNRIKPGKS
jgi:hypothetical protein